MKKVLHCIGSILICHAAGASGAVFTREAVPGWYQTLAKPWFNPPAWVFTPVWLVLYTMMGIVLFLIWTDRKASSSDKYSALALFFAQLVLNALWSAVFFGMRSIAGGLAVIVPLWLLISATVIASCRVSRTAAWLLVPYLIWVGFAAALNAGYYQLNR